MIDYSEIPFSTDDLEELKELNISFVFQPIFDIKNLEIIAVEALMRPKGMTPLELIDEYQKKKKLHVIEIATCFGSTMEYKKRGYNYDICINSFPSEYLNEGQMGLYFECFPEMEGKIIVEMVEYTELSRLKWNVKKQEIRGYDMRLALDDYSTGNNNIYAVEYFNPHYVKFDRTMITDIHLDKDKQDRIDELVEEFKEKGIKMIAEGVETEEEFNYIRDNTDIDYVQGYYLARPS